jgi:hypothetical protein
VSGTLLIALAISFIVRGFIAFGESLLPSTKSTLSDPPIATQHHRLNPFARTSLYFGK